VDVVDAGVDDADPDAGAEGAGGQADGVGPDVRGAEKGHAGRVVRILHHDRQDALDAMDLQQAPNIPGIDGDRDAVHRLADPVELARAGRIRERFRDAFLGRLDLQHLGLRGRAGDVPQPVVGGQAALHRRREDHSRRRILELDQDLDAAIVGGRGVVERHP
jgi:hypothetical protein